MEFVAVLLFLIVIGAISLLFSLYRLRVRAKAKFQHGSDVKLCVVLGSGGHTMEMMRLIQTLPGELVKNLVFILADTDKMGVQKIREFESAKSGQFQSLQIHRIPRSREVKQSFFTAVYTTIKSILATIPIIYRSKPDVLLVNGPGTCVPACLVAFFLGMVHFKPCRIIFVESICRVTTLSLTGKILYFGNFADDIIVQWADLRDQYPGVTYLGRLC